MLAAFDSVRPRECDETTELTSNDNNKVVLRLRPKLMLRLRHTDVMHTCTPDTCEQPTASSQSATDEGADDGTQMPGADGKSDNCHI